MGRAVQRLNAVAVKNATAPGRYADGEGLYLAVDAKGGKSWLCFYQMRGKRREMGLGSLRNVSLAQARVAARSARDAVRAGRDPIADRASADEATRLIPSLADAAEAVIADLEGGWRTPKTAKSWRRSFELHAAPIVGLPVDRVSTEDVLSVLRPVWLDKPETGKKLRERMETVLDAAKVRGWRAGENPARLRGHLSHLLPKSRKLSRGHFPAMPYETLPAFMVTLAANTSVSARALEWVILTAARQGMARGARWSEIDEGGKVWNVPGERMKAGRALRVPLSPAALAVLDRVRRPETSPDDLIFPGSKAGKPLSDMALNMLLRDLAPPFTPHGFRSTFRDWAGDCTDFARDVAEVALAHVVGDETERAYRRGDAFEKRRGLMDAWGAYACPLDGQTARPAD